MTQLRRSGMLGIALLLCAAARARGVPDPIIIDTDPGTDDALAILLALNSPELDVKAITVVPGNVSGNAGSLGENV